MQNETQENPENAQGNFKGLTPTFNFVKVTE